MKKLDYDTIYDLYEIKCISEKAHAKRRQNIQKKLKYHLKKYLKKLGLPEESNFSDLDKHEQEYFICHEINDMMLAESDASVEKIDQNLSEFAGDKLYEAEKIIRKRNKKIHKIREKRKGAHIDDSESYKRQVYQELCDDMADIGEKPLPYNSNTLYNLSIYDEMKNVDDYHTQMQANEYFISRKDMTPILMSIIYQIFDLNLDFETVEKHVVDYREMCNNRRKELRQSVDARFGETLDSEATQKLYLDIEEEINAVITEILLDALGLEINYPKIETHILDFEANRGYGKDYELFEWKENPFPLTFREFANKNTYKDTPEGYTSYEEYLEYIKKDYDKTYNHMIAFALYKNIDVNPKNFYSISKEESEIMKRLKILRNLK